MGLQIIPGKVRHFHANSPRTNPQVLIITPCSSTPRTDRVIAEISLAGCAERQVLVTGGNEFVGSNLWDELNSHGHEARAAVKTARAAPVRCEEVTIGNIDESTDWTHAFQGQGAVVCNLLPTLSLAKTTRWISFPNSDW